MRRVIADVSLQASAKRKYLAFVTVIMLSVVATIAAAQVTGEVTPEDAEELLRYLQTYAVPRWWLVFAAMCVAPWLLAFIGLGGSNRSAAITGYGPQPADHLRKVSILGSKYNLEVYTCKVMNEKSWTETTYETTTTVGGNWSGSGYWQTSMSPYTQVSTTSTSTKKDQVRVRYPDRTRGSWEFTNMNFVVEPGDIISLVARKVGNQHECLLAYNHDSTQFLSFSLLHTHAISGRLTWIVLTLIGALGASWGWSAAILEVIKDYVPQLGLPADVPATPMDTSVWIAAFLAGSIVASIPLFICGALLPKIRTMIFKTTIMPGVKYFLQSITAEVRHSFPLEWQGQQGRVAPAG